VSARTGRLRWTLNRSSAEWTHASEERQEYAPITFDALWAELGYQ
jgi:hypothetical protein